MFNQIKSDLYKLQHSLVLKLFLIIIMLLFGTYIAMSFSYEGFAMGYSIEKVKGYDLVHGFMTFAFDNAAVPTYMEVIYSSVSMTFFMWMLLLVVTIMTFSKEFTTGSIKLAYAKGNSKIKLLWSKLIIVCGVFFSVYLPFNILAYIYTSLKYGTGMSSGGFADVILSSVLMFLPMVIMSYMAMTLFLLFQNAALVISSMVIFMFSYVFIDIGMQISQSNPFIVQLYSVINPMSYIWVACNYWADSALIRNVILYFVLGFIILSGLSWYLLEKREVK